MADRKDKLYVFVDESGQDTKGQLFVVGVLVLDTEGLGIEKQLEAIEQESGKRNVKWNGARYAYRRAYISALVAVPEVRQRLFFETFSDTQKYLQLTAFTTAKAILRRAKGQYEATVFVDGLRRAEIDEFRRGLQALRIKTRKIRGVRREQNNPYIRLVDAVCGLVRDALDGDTWAQEVVKGRFVTPL